MRILPLLSAVSFVLFMSLTCNGDQRQISVVLDANYSKTHAIQLNGRHIPDRHVLRALSEVISGNSAPFVVLVPSTARFEDWDDIMAIFDKIGYSNVRYFVFSKATKRMNEIDPPHAAVEFSLTPPPRGVQ